MSGKPQRPYAVEPADAFSSAGAPEQGAPAAPRVRLSREERRRQLVGIGLRKLVERPIQDVSIDEVAAEAGISRGLLFHYFPTKTDFHAAVVMAAGRRVLRNTRPDDGVPPEVALEQVVRRFLDQVDRRRDSYLALVYGKGAIEAEDGLAAESLRAGLAQNVIGALGLADNVAPVVHGWVAYLEDRALQWSEIPKAKREDLEALVAHCTQALHALLSVVPDKSVVS